MLNKIADAAKALYLAAKAREIEWKLQKDPLVSHTIRVGWVIKIVYKNGHTEVINVEDE